MRSPIFISTLLSALLAHEILAVPLNIGSLDGIESKRDNQPIPVSAFPEPDPTPIPVSAFPEPTPEPTTFSGSPPFQGFIPVLAPPAVDTTLTTSIKIGQSLVQFGILDDYPGGLQAAIISALDSICDEEGCDTTSPATIPNINFGAAGTKSIQTGTLSLTVSNSDYTSTDQRDGMIALMAAAWETTANANCQQVTFQQGCTKKRTLGSSFGNGGTGSTVPDCETKTVTNCMSSNFLSTKITVPVKTEDPNNPIKPTLLATMDVTVSFDGSVEPFDCNGFIGTLSSVLDLFPEGEGITKDVSDALGKISPICALAGDSS